jgi:hypothetical protein
MYIALPNCALLNDTYENIIKLRKRNLYVEKNYTRNYSEVTGVLKVIFSVTNIKIWWYIPTTIMTHLIGAGN